LKLVDFNVLPESVYDHGPRGGMYAEKLGQSYV